MNLAKRTPYTLRRTFALNLLAKGYPFNQLQALLDHQNLSTTNSYTKVTVAENPLKYLLDSRKEPQTMKQQQEQTYCGRVSREYAERNCTFILQRVVYNNRLRGVVNLSLEKV